MRDRRMLVHVLTVLLMSVPCSPAPADSVINTIAGQGSPGGDSGDGGAATAALIKNAEGVAVDADGNIYIADTNNSRIRRIDAVTGVITTVAGLGSPGGSTGDGGPATSAKVKTPEGVFVDGAGNIYIGDTGNDKVRKIDAATGIITTIAGTGTKGDDGDGGPAVDAELKGPTGLFVDANDNVFIADTANHKIRKIDGTTGIITTVAGASQWGDTGDGGPATSAKLKQPEGVWVDADGNMFIADTDNNKIRRVDGTFETITTIAGQGANQAGDTGEGGPAVDAELKLPQGVALDADGNIFVSDTANHKIKRIDAVTGIITTIAGLGGSGGDGGDGGSPTAAELKGPTSIAWLPDAEDEDKYHILIADAGNSRIRKISLGGVTILSWQEVDPIVP